MNYNLNRAMIKAYEIIENRPASGLGKAVHIFMMVLISANVVMVVLETESAITDLYGYLLHPFKVFSIAVFTAEYAARMATCTVDPRCRNAGFAHLRFAFTPMMLIDLVAILPFFLPFVITDLRFVRIIRLFRLFRIFKFARYSESMQTLGHVFKARTGDLFVAFFVLGLVWVFASALMYHAEHEAQPEKFGSIPASMWWGIVTLATIGYGDAYPITAVGKIVGTGVAILGIVVYALPTAIMASAFTEELRNKRLRNRCPHCGMDI